MRTVSDRLRQIAVDLFDEQQRVIAIIFTGAAHAAFNLIPGAQAIPSDHVGRHVEIALPGQIMVGPNEAVAVGLNIQNADVAFGVFGAVVGFFLVHHAAHFVDEGAGFHAVDRFQKQHGRVFFPGLGRPHLAAEQIAGDHFKFCNLRRRDINPGLVFSSVDHPIALGHDGDGTFVIFGIVKIVF